LGRRNVGNVHDDCDSVQERAIPVRLVVWGSFVLAEYNRKYFRTFALSVLVLVGFVALINALFLMGWLKFGQ
jgi:hypothetical protein